MTQKHRSTLLKVALFATGMSGIVAEYLLSTLATYFLGDATKQWTLIVSLMLFSMGLGARFSSSITKNVLSAFLAIELVLSLLVGLSGSCVYMLAAETVYLPVLIYALCIGVGLLIGMEIPLVMRINESYDELRVNVSSVLENDYYGSLLGGIFFAFVAIPIVGLTQTPYILAAINFTVSIVLCVSLKGFSLRSLYGTAAVFTAAILIAGSVFADDIVLHGEQKRYKDKVVFSDQSKYQSIVLTQWKESYWLYLNGNLQFSSIDELSYHESLVVPALAATAEPKSILIVGGGDGLAARTLLQLCQQAHIQIVDLDPAVTVFATNHPVMTQLNDSSLHSPRVSVANSDAFTWLESSSELFDIIIIDLPDPRSVDLARLYSAEFYEMCQRHLSQSGVVVTQSSNPFLAGGVYRSVCASMQSVGLVTKAYREHIPSFGQWSWVLGAKDSAAISEPRLLSANVFERTTWLDAAMFRRMLVFGNNPLVNATSDSTVNTLSNPILHTKYMDSRWDLN